MLDRLSYRTKYCFVFSIGLKLKFMRGHSSSFTGGGAACGCLCLVSLVICCVYFAYYIENHNIWARLVDVQNCVIVNTYSVYNIHGFFSQETDYFLVLNYTAGTELYTSSCLASIDNKIFSSPGELLACSYDAKYPSHVYLRDILDQEISQDQWLAIIAFIFLGTCICCTLIWCGYDYYKTRTRQSEISPPVAPVVVHMS